MTKVRTDPLPGDLIFCHVHGAVGALIGFGQWLVGDASPYEHVAIYLGDNKVIAAQPGGVRIDDLASCGDDYLASTHLLPLTPAQREDICRIAVAKLKVKYSFAAYFYIALHRRFGIDAGWLKKRIEDSGHVICSQYADDTLHAAGVDIFDDGRWPGNVDPGEMINEITRSL